MDKLGFILSNKLLAVISGLIFTGVTFTSNEAESLLNSFGIATPETKIPEVRNMTSPEGLPGQRRQEGNAPTAPAAAEPPAANTVITAPAFGSDDADIVPQPAIGNLPVTPAAVTAPAPTAAPVPLSKPAVGKDSASGSKKGSPSKQKEVKPKEEKPKEIKPKEEKPKEIKPKEEKPKEEKPKEVDAPDAELKKAFQKAKKDNAPDSEIKKPAKSKKD